MRKSKFTDEQIAFALKQAEVGIAFVSLSRHGHITIAAVALKVVIFQGEPRAIGVFQLQVIATAFGHDIVE